MTPDAPLRVRWRTQTYLGYGTGNVYDGARDGQQFLVNVVDEELAPPLITVITNWPATVQ